MESNRVLTSYVVILYPILNVGKTFFLIKPNFPLKNSQVTRSADDNSTNGAVQEQPVTVAALGWGGVLGVWDWLSRRWCMAGLRHPLTYSKAEGTHLGRAQGSLHDRARWWWAADPSSVCLGLGAGGGQRLLLGPQ